MASYDWGILQDVDCCFAVSVCVSTTQMYADTIHLAAFCVTHV